MKCLSCNSEKVLVESVGDGKVRVSCQKCGESTVRDQQGRRLLTDDMSPNGQPLLG